MSERVCPRLSAPRRWRHVAAPSTDTYNVALRATPAPSAQSKPQPERSRTASFIARRTFRSRCGRRRGVTPDPRTALLAALLALSACRRASPEPDAVATVHAPAAPTAPSASIEPPSAAPSASSSALPEERRFLVIGDSHLLGGLGAGAQGGAGPRRARSGLVSMRSCGWSSSVVEQRLADALRDGVGPARRASQTLGCGKMLRLDALLASVKPHVTLIVMGQKFLTGVKELAGPTREMLGRLEEAHSRCAWLGPPVIDIPREGRPTSICPTVFTLLPRAR